MRYSRGSLASDISLLNAYCRLSNVNTFSGGQPVDLARCGVDAHWLSRQLKGLALEEKEARWVLRGNRGCQIFWKHDGEPGELSPTPVQSHPGIPSLAKTTCGR
mgnify:CR=1 FL=1